MIEIRPATPEDAEAVSELIYMADTGVTGVSGWDLAFREPKEEILEKIQWMFIHADRIWTHYSRYIVGEIEGRIVGTLCTFSREDGRYRAWWKSLRDMGLNNRQILGVIWRVMPFLRVNPSVPKNTLVVESAAIVPDFRAMGFAELGLKEVLKKAQREGYKKVQVSVVIGNIAPQRVCENFGFKVQDEYRARSFRKKFGAPGMRRLVLEVEP